jgi:hypothetical protein
MSVHRLFNITVEMNPRRTIMMCICVAAFFVTAGMLYDASALIDKPVRAWLG